MIGSPRRGQAAEGTGSRATSTCAPAAGGAPDAADVPGIAAQARELDGHVRVSSGHSALHQIAGASDAPPA